MDTSLKVAETFPGAQQIARTVKIPRFEKLLDEHLLAKNKAEGDREIAGGMTWRASKLGSCLKQQYLEFHLKQPKLEEFDARTLRRFEVGHQAGRQWGVWFREMGFDVKEEVVLTDPLRDIGAHGDYDLGDFGVELKSVSSQWFWYRAKAQETTASPENMMQAAICSFLADKPWIVLTYSKDDLTMNQDLVTPEHIAEARSRLQQLNEAKKTGVAPPCTCLDTWHWKYCPWYAGDPEARKKKGGKPDGLCCQEIVNV